MSISITAGILGSAAIPTLFFHPVIDFLIRRVTLGFAISGSTFLMTGLVVATIEDKLIPLVGRIREKYNEEALTQKKKVLDEVIDKEILK